MRNKLFTEKQIASSAILAGPISAGLFISLNFMTLGKKREALTSFILIFFLFGFLFYLTLLIPEDIFVKIPSIFFSSFYGLLTYLFFRHKISDSIKNEIESGVEIASIPIVIGGCIVGLVLTIVLMLGIVSVQPAYPGNVSKFGKNEIYYEEFIETQQVEKLAGLLYEYEYFDNEYGAYVHLQKNDGKLLLTIPLDKEVWEDQEILDILSNLKNDIGVELGLPCEIVLEHYLLSGKTERKKI